MDASVIPKLLASAAVLIFMLSLYKGGPGVPNPTLLPKEASSLPEATLQIDSTFEQTGFHLLYQAKLSILAKELGGKDDVLQHCKAELQWNNLPRDVLVDLESLNRAASYPIKYETNKKVDIEAAANQASSFSLHAKDIPNNAYIQIKLQARYIEASTEARFYKFTLPKPNFRLLCNGAEGLLINAAPEETSLITAEKAQRYRFLYRLVANKSDHLRVTVPIMPKRAEYISVTLLVHTALSLLVSAFLLRPLISK